MTLLKEDIDILVEALDSWLKRDIPGEMVSELLGAIFFKGDELSRKAWEEERKDEKAKRTGLKKDNEEIAALLKSKLILMKRSL